MTKAPHTDQKYIDALLNNDASLIEEIYQQWHKDVLTLSKRIMATSRTPTIYFRNL